MSVAVKKLDGVQSVNVSLNKGLVMIDLAAGNHLTMSELRHVITVNGFSPKEATVVVDGVLEDRTGTVTLTSNVTNESFVLLPTPTAASAFNDLKRMTSQADPVEINGRVDPPKGLERLTVVSVKRLTP